LFFEDFFHRKFCKNLHPIEKHKALEKIRKKKKAVNTNGDGYYLEVLEGLDALSM